MLPISDFNYKHETTTKKVELIGKIKLRVLVVFSVFLTLLFASQLVFASNLASGGQKLFETEQEISKIESENLNLKAKIAEVSSYRSLSQKAETMGFKQPSKVISP